MPDSEIPVSELFGAREQILRESWARSTEAFFERLGRFLTSPALYDEVKGLLLALLDLVERPGIPGDAQAGLADVQLRRVLGQLRRIQERDGVGPTEMVFFLFSVKEILEDALRGARDSAGGELTTQVQAVARVSSLLNRLGLVLFETDVRARDGSAFHESELAMEYALLYERARRIAITDQLTGLHNFGYFRDRLREEHARAERYQRLLSLIIFDIDHFKLYNDQHGHPAGNGVLVTIASILREQVREVDIVARYGGEEFVVLLPEATRREATRMAARISEIVAATAFPLMESQPLGRLTLSAGVATYPVDAANGEELVERADESLYEAKRTGRSRVVAYEPPHQERLVFYPGRPVSRVALVGSFNNWDKDYDLMNPTGDGAYVFVIALSPGDYQYKFVVEGNEWIPDPRNPHRSPDGLGGENSVLRVRA
jgi:diguanylate cyclase (GGDEF)-like protein